MGRKSRLKKERRAKKIEETMQNEVFKKLFTLDKYDQPIYRFFSEKWQADALCEGKIWVSTLEECRKYECPLQGDPDEATEIYKSGHIVGGGGDPEFVEMAARSGVSIGGGASNITISDCTNIKRLPDAYVLCTTSVFNPSALSETFGNYCVKISNPIEFFKRVSLALNEVCTIKEGAVGLVQYKERHYTGLDNRPGPIGFVKPKEKYSPQNEFRFLWLPEAHGEIQPFLLECLEVSELCAPMA